MERKRFKCEVCHKGFVTSTTLLKHQRIHTGEKPFTCEQCDKSFSDSSNLRRHQRIHTGEKPYKCEVCNKSFADSSTLRQHKGVHTREKTFTCEVCNKSFSVSSTLCKHRRTHTGEQEKHFRCDFCKKAFNQISHLLSHQRIHTGMKAFMCKVKLAHNTQERSLTGGQVPYIKELTEQEEFTRKLFGLSNPTIINGGSDMGMSEDIQLPMDTSDGDGEELVAASEIPERANEEGTEVNTSQQCGMAAAVEEGEECQEGKMSDLEGSVGGLKLNIMACVKEESCDDPAAVVEGGRSELSVDEEPAALGAESPPSPQAHGQHQAHAAGEENEDDLKHLERLHQEQVQSTESYQASSNLLLQTLTEFKMDVSQNLQRNNEILQQQNEILCQLLQRSNETLNEMRQILSQIVVPTPYGQQQPSAETSTAGHAFGTGEVTLRGWGRHRRN